jgi:hypothetical protein
MMKSIFLAGALALAVGMTGALAQRIENREDRQKARTRQGVKSGELTDKEAARLLARQRNLDQKVKQDRVDGGGLSAAERARIEARQDKISRDLAKQKHDGQKK